MEKSVAEADKVLILCNKVYKDKADNRNGGAGQETMIIAPEVYEKIHQRNLFLLLWSMIV